MQEYRFVKPLRTKKLVCLCLGHIYRIKKVGVYFYEVYTIDFDIKVCCITQKALNYSFEKVN